MKMKMENSAHFEGFLYDASKLEKKVTGPNSKNPGTHYIGGDLSIATDDECLNVVKVHFSYVTETTKAGNANATYQTLAEIIDRGRSVITDGKDNAMKVRFDGSLDVNDFYVERNGNPELVTSVRNEGSFIHIVSAIEPNIKKRNKLTLDLVVANAQRVEGDLEKGTSDKMILRCAAFGYKNVVKPFNMSVINPRAMDWFESQTYPVFLSGAVGEEINETIIKSVTKEGAFGEDMVVETKSSHKDRVLTWISAEPAPQDDTSTITWEEFKKLTGDRELMLADLKRRYEEYHSSPVNNSNAGFNF